MFFGWRTTKQFHALLRRGVAEGALVAAATKRGLPDGPDEAGPSPRGGGTDGATDGEGASRTPPSAPLGRALFGRRWREITVRTEIGGWCLTPGETDNSLTPGRAEMAIAGHLTRRCEITVRTKRGRRGGESKGEKK